MNSFAHMADDKKLKEPPFSLDPSNAAGSPLLNPSAGRRRPSSSTRGRRPASVPTRRTRPRPNSERAGHLPLVVPSGEFVAVRLSFVATTDKHYLAGCKKLSEAPWKPRVYRTFPTVGGCTNELDGLILDGDDSFRVKRLQHSIPLPKHSEKMRSRIRVLAASYTVAGCPTRPRRGWLRSHPACGMPTWTICWGQKCWSFLSRWAGVEHTLDRPLSLSSSIRSAKVCSLKGQGHSQAMDDARGNDKLRSTYSVTAAFLSIMKKRCFLPVPPGAPGSSLPGDSPLEARRAAAAEGTAGALLERAKAAVVRVGSSLWTTGCRTRRPERQQICFAWNNHDQLCLVKPCPRARVCRRCFKPHPVHEHPKQSGECSQRQPCRIFQVTGPGGPDACSAAIATGKHEAAGLGYVASCD